MLVLEYNPALFHLDQQAGGLKIKIGEKETNLRESNSCNREQQQQQQQCDWGTLSVLLVHSLTRPYGNIIHLQMLFDLLNHPLSHHSSEHGLLFRVVSIFLSAV